MKKNIIIIIAYILLVLNTLALYKALKLLCFYHKAAICERGLSDMWRTAFDELQRKAE